MTKNWPTPVDAFDYMRQEQKKVAIEERRPVIRRASDLVGPGIAASAVRITDWADTLATFNGYYCSLPGVTGAPNTTHAFVGFTVMDAEVGGTQTVVSMTNGVEYRRTFSRNPADPEFISWGPWLQAQEQVAATVESTGPKPTSVPTGVLTDLLMPSVTKIGDSDPYLVSPTRLTITQPGVYTGYLLISDGLALANLDHTHPSLSGLRADTRINIGANGYRMVPLTFATTAINQYISVKVAHATGITESISISYLTLIRTSRI